MATIQGTRGEDWTLTVKRNNPTDPLSAGRMLDEAGRLYQFLHACVPCGTLYPAIARLLAEATPESRQQIKTLERKIRNNPTGE